METCDKMASHTHEKAVADVFTDKRSISPSTSDVNSEDLDEASLLRKLDAHLLPGVTLLYLLSFLDRSNGKSPVRRAVSNN